MDSISGTTKSSQEPVVLHANISPKDPTDISDFSLAGDKQEILATLDQSSEHGSQEVGEGMFPNPYKYPEFAGYAGRAYLCNIVKQILPTALYDTWLSAMSYQAPGNDIFVGNAKMQRDMAMMMNLSDRTLRERWQELEHRQLVSFRADLRKVKQQDGTWHLVAVKIKDFSGLYDLAHEFHEWRTSEMYIAPLREHAEAIMTDLELMVWLCRFYCYKRIFSRPGRKPQEQVSYDQELRQFASTLISQQQGQSPASQVRAKDAEESSSDEKNTKWQLISKSLSKKSATYSKNRDHFNDNDRAATIFRKQEEKKGLPAETIRNEQAKADGRETANTVTNTERLIIEQGEAKSTSNTPNGLEKHGAGGAAANNAEANKKGRKRHTKGERPPVELPEHLCAWLKRVSSRFGDRSHESSKTSLAWMYADVVPRGLNEWSEAFHELIQNAYNKTERTLQNGDIHAVNPDGSYNAMKHFLTTLEWDVTAWCDQHDRAAAVQTSPTQQTSAEEEEETTSNNESASSHESRAEGVGQVQEEQGTDQTEHQTVASVQRPADGETQHEDDPVSGSAEASDASAQDRQAPSPAIEQRQDTDANDAEKTSAVQKSRQTLPQEIAVDDQQEGWQYQSAQFYADHLRQTVGQDTYDVSILPTIWAGKSTGRYGFLLIERGTGNICPYVSADKVRERERISRFQRRSTSPGGH